MHRNVENVCGAGRNGLAKTALITGGAGFIGSALLRLLLRKKYSVTVLDDLSFGRREHVPPGVRFIRGDVRKTTALKRAVDRQYGAVFHLAALHFIPYCNAHPEKTLEVNVGGTETLLRRLRELPPRRFFLASTAAVYGPAAVRHRERETPRPMDVYGASKLAAESAVRRFARETGVGCTIGRLFNAYGPRETNPHLIPAIVDQLKEGARELKLGNLSPRRDFIHTGDMARAILLLILKARSGVTTANVAAGDERSVREVVGAFESCLKREILVRSVVPRKRRVERRRLAADLSTIRRLTGFRPRISFEGGIRELCRTEGLLVS